MRALAPTLLLLAAPALGAPQPAAPEPVSAPIPVSSSSDAASAPVVAPVPVPVQPAQDAASGPARAPEPVGPSTSGATSGGAPARSAGPPASSPASAAGAPAASAAKPPFPPPAAPTKALVEKLGQGDRLFLAGDYRNALFAYQDAVYMQPSYAPSRVKLGKAYLALRYATQALAQAEAALAADPGSADARKLLEEAKNPPARPAAAPETTVPATASPARSAPRVFRFTPEPDAAAPAAPPPAAAPAGGAERIVTIVPLPSASAAEPQAVAGSIGADPASGAAPTPSPGSAAQHYRAALVHLQNRDWTKAVSELSNAIAADPKLAVAYAARGSARFGLGKYRDAAEDYRNALLLDPKLATPVYGLAECYRVLGDARHAAEMYERYAGSSAADVREDLRTVSAKRARELR